MVQAMSWFSSFLHLDMSMLEFVHEGNVLLPEQTPRMVPFPLQPESPFLSSLSVQRWSMQIHAFVCWWEDAVGGRIQVGMSNEEDDANRVDVRYKERKDAKEISKNSSSKRKETREGKLPHGKKQRYVPTTDAPTAEPTHAMLGREVRLLQVVGPESSKASVIFPSQSKAAKIGLTKISSTRRSRGAMLATKAAAAHLQRIVAKKPTLSSKLSVCVEAPVV